MAGQIPKRPVQPKKTPAKRAPSKAVAKPEEKSEFTPKQAEALTEKIKKSAANTFEDIKKAYLGRIWLALGHKSWDEYCDKHYEGVPLALPREKKKEAIQSLAAAGLSSRAIAAATGLSQSTATRVASKVTDPAPTPPAATPPAESNDSGGPDVIDAEVIDPPEGGEQAPEPEGRTVQGADGKSYNVTPKEPTVINIVSAARNLVKDLENTRIRLDSLFSRDDYEENQVAVQGTLETAVGDLLDTLADEFGDLLRERAPEAEVEAEPELEPELVP